MQQTNSTYHSSNCQHGHSFVENDNGIGLLFRLYGEKYIVAFKPDLQKIKLIRSIRICKTPALGGKRITCKNCGKESFVYFGCGNSQCPKCQGVKRLQWQDKLSNRMLKVPYQHIIFTLPDILRSLARIYPNIIYNILMRSATTAIMSLCKIPDNVGALPGIIAVLHTFGSDLKFHPHVHCLVTFGGLDDNGTWHWPKRKNKLAPFRSMRRTFKDLFLNELEKFFVSNQISYIFDFNSLKVWVSKKQWCVHNEPPTSNTKVIEEYLGRYICRIGLSKNKFHFDSVHNSVSITFNDYKNQTPGLPAPKSQLSLKPLLAIDHILQHVLPPYFQKCRYYGLHAPASFKSLKHKIPNAIKRQPNTIRTLFQIIKSMLGLDVTACDNCGASDFIYSTILPDKYFIHSFLNTYSNNKSPPAFSSYYPSYPLCFHDTNNIFLSQNYYFVPIALKITPPPVQF